MKRLQSGSKEAFGLLYDRYGTTMFNYFHRMLWKDREKAQDFSQDLFMKLIQQPQAWDQQRSFKTWLYSIAHNMCKNEYKKQQVRNALDGHLTELHPEDSNHVPLLENLDKVRFNRRLDEALNHLAPQYRDVFTLRYRQELSLKEISEITDVPEGTVKSRLFHSLKKLAALMPEYHPQKLK